MSERLVPEALWAILLGQGAFAVLTHCPGMCGPLMLAFRLQGPAAGTLAVLAYQGGRATVYAGLGLIAGLVGGALATALARILPWATLVLAVVLGLVALAQLLGRTPRWPSITPGWLQHVVKTTAGRGIGPSYLLGLGMAALPCGLVLWSLGLAAATADPLWGATTMVLLVVLTTPVLIVAHLAGRSATAPFARWGQGRFAWVPAVLLLGSAVWLGTLAAQKLLAHGPAFCLNCG